MEWISVKDRMPELCKDVLVIHYDKYLQPIYKVFSLYRDSQTNEYSWYDLFQGKELTLDIKNTHWMELPNQPKD